MFSNSSFNVIGFQLRSGVSAAVPHAVRWTSPRLKRTIGVRVSEILHGKWPWPDLQVVLRKMLRACSVAHRNDPVVGKKDEGVFHCFLVIRSSLSYTLAMQTKKFSGMAQTFSAVHAITPFSRLLSSQPSVQSIGQISTFVTRVRFWLMWRTLEPSPRPTTFRPKPTTRTDHVPPKTDYVPGVW
jgi:hypothetical protein